MCVRPGCGRRASQNRQGNFCGRGCRDAGPPNQRSQRGDDLLPEAGPGQSFEAFHGHLACKDQGGHMETGEFPVRSNVIHRFSEQNSFQGRFSWGLLCSVDVNGLRTCTNCRTPL